MNYTATEIANLVSGQVHGEPQSQIIQFVAIDSRRIHFPASTLFVALQGSLRNGIQFVQDAYRQGVRVFLVDSTPNISQTPEAIFVEVPNTLLALQHLASQHRLRYRIPVLAITGSNGKTIVKEWLYQLLEPDFYITRSPKSYNSQIGVPLSILQINPQTNFSILEAGVSQQGEMEALENMIRPNLGLFTMLGDAHNEGFLNEGEKLKEKFLLFRHCHSLICRVDNPLVAQQANLFTGQLISWGSQPQATVQVFKMIHGNNETVVEFDFKDIQSSVEIPFTDEASVENAMHCVVFMLSQGYSVSKINERLRLLTNLDWRLQWKEGIHNTHLLNDSYSNDFTSLTFALDYFKQQARHPRRSIILSDLSVHEKEIPERYLQLEQLLDQYQVNRVIGVGPQMETHFKQQKKWPFQVLSFLRTEDLLQQLPKLEFDDEDVLIKGGRRFGLERVAERLENKQHETQLEINLSALLNNLRYFQKYLESQTGIMVMVKAFGYGGGAAEIAKKLEFAGVQYLAVAYVDEGVSLREAGITLPIMVMNSEMESFHVLESFNLEPEVYSPEFLQRLIDWCKRMAIANFPIHIKIDTGMHRLGFLEADWDWLADKLASQPYVKVKSVFTHLASSEEADQDSFTEAQQERFERASNILAQKLDYPVLRHAANTSAIVRHPQIHYEMVRLGIGLYGGLPGLENVMKLNSTIAQVKKVKAGETVGYGRTGLLFRDSLIAVVRIGYADGYPRSLSNGNAYMLVNGVPAKTVGRICMDMTMLDVTDLPHVKAGDLVEVFGNNLSVNQLASWAGTISYEIMTGIGLRVKRVYVDG